MTEPMRAWTAETLIDAYGDELLRLCLLYLGDRQLAEALHIPQNSVSSRLRRARAMLQTDMEGGKDA